MKIAEPTRVIITSMQADNGSRTNPTSTCPSPTSNQDRLYMALGVSSVGGTRVQAKATQETINAPNMAAIARVAAVLRWGCLSSALSAAASNGNNGISQR